MRFQPSVVLGLGILGFLLAGCGGDKETERPQTTASSKSPGAAESLWKITDAEATMVIRAFVKRANDGVVEECKRVGDGSAGSSRWACEVRLTDRARSKQRLYVVSLGTRDQVVVEQTR